MIYSFEDKETGEEFEYDLTYEQLQEFLVDFPNLVQTFRINIADPVGMGKTSIRFPEVCFRSHQGNCSWCQKGCIRKKMAHT
jgi:hypothetical protein